MRSRKPSQLSAIGCLMVGTVFGSITYAGAGSWWGFVLGMGFLLAGMGLMKRYDVAVEASKNSIED